MRITTAAVEAALLRARAATPGRWRWRGNTTAHDIELVATGVPALQNNRVLTFMRWGMQDAMPTLLDHARGIIEPCTRWFVRPEPHNAWMIRGIDHPDAILLEHAREDVEDLAADLLDARRALLTLHDRLSSEPFLERTAARILVDPEFRQAWIVAEALAIEHADRQQEVAHA